MTDKAFLEGRKYARAQLGRVLVLGLGVSGKAGARYFLDLLGTRVEALHIAAGKRNDAAEAWAAQAVARGAVVSFDTESFSESYDLCIASPGISEFSDFYLNAAAASTEIISEVEFAWRESAADSRWIAITGTNGKTTTTAMIEHVLKSAGLSAAAVGNIGDACIDAVANQNLDIYVAEVSSYQLASTRAFAPNVALVLNITPDHLSWHGSHEAYAAAKWKILDNLPQVPGAVAVLDATNDEVRAKVRELRALSGEERGFAYIPVGTKAGLAGDMRQACGSDNAAFVDGEGVLRVAVNGSEFALCAADALRVKGSHNVANALAAASAALAVGVEPQAVADGVSSFQALEHRIEPCGDVAGVECYNDSKATNVDSVLAAVAAFGSVKPIIMLGGRDKGTDLAPLVAACCQHAKSVVCFGEARDRFIEAFEGAELEVLSAPCMEAALDEALSVAVAGDVVLLSPACASFDEFSCYQERGTRFKQMVAERSAAVKGE